MSAKIIPLASHPVAIARRRRRSVWPDPAGVLAVSLCAASACAMLAASWAGVAFAASALQHWEDRS